jgi:hypothetical protein
MLYEADVKAGQFLDAAFVEAFEKEAALIAEYSRLNYQDVGNGCRDNLH